MRTFIALNVSEEIKHHLLEVQETIFSCQKQNFKASKAKEFHLTLKFLGEVNEKELDKIKSALQKVRFDKFELKLSGIGCFPSSSNIRVIWAGLLPDAEIKSLQKKIDDATSSIKCDNNFHPHITLFRVKHVNDKDALKLALSKIKVKEILFSVDSFYLYKSTLTPCGPVYVVVFLGLCRIFKF